MTAPVVNSPPEFSPSTPTAAPTDTAETVPMTAPVLTTGAQTTRAPKTAQTMGGQTMAFVLPSSFSTVSSAPLPTDPAVRLRARPARLMAAIRFSGRCAAALAERKAAERAAAIAAEEARRAALSPEAREAEDRAGRMQHRQRGGQQSR